MEAAFLEQYAARGYEKMVCLFYLSYLGVWFFFGRGEEEKEQAREGKEF